MYDLRLTQPNKEKKGARSSPIFWVIRICVPCLPVLLLLLSSTVSRGEPFQLPGNDFRGHRFTTQMKVLLLVVQEQNFARNTATTNVL